VLTCYITDRSRFAGGEAERRVRLLETIRRCSAAGVDFIQLREKDLTARELEALAREALAAARDAGGAKLLINHRTDIALAVGADGVHLTGSDVAASEARAVATAAQPGRAFLVAVSCHSAEEVRQAAAEDADFAALAPVFEKVNHNGHAVRAGIGLDELRRAVRQRIPVFALGGVNEENAALCAAAGAAGVAGIRLFQQATDLTRLVRSLGEL
jgi:thiamine-phosphate pyrophosphorylase